MRGMLKKDINKKNIKIAKIKFKMLPYVYIFPAVLVILLLVIYPMVYTFIISLTNLNVYHWKNPSFIGLKNYIKILGKFDSDFFEVMLRTIIWTVINMFVHVFIAFVLAMLLNIKDLKFKGIYRTLLIVPWAIPGYISILIWKGMFNYDFGTINLVLKALGLKGVSWLSNAYNAIIACTIVNVWLAVPFMMVVILGGLQSIDYVYYEVADIEGASFRQKLRYVTMPLLKPTVVPALIITLFVTFKQFDVVYLLTKGLAGRTDLVITYAYTKAFGDFRYGYSAAFSVIIFIILLLLTKARNKVIRSAEEVYR